MFEGLMARAATLGAAAAARRRSRIAAAAADIPPGVAVREAAEAIVVAGRNLSRRRLGDARLRAFLESLR
jgi:hypothetical protein